MEVKNDDEQSIWAALPKIDQGRRDRRFFRAALAGHKAAERRLETKGAA
jgi:hypothetical protein